MTEPTSVSAHTARKSALTAGAVFLLIAAWSFYRDRPAAVAVTGGLGSIIVAVGLLWPAGALAFHSGWMRLAAVLGWVNSRILLGIMLYGIMTPMGRLMRLFGRDPLDRHGPKRETYWIRRERTRQPRGQFERLF